MLAAIRFSLCAAATGRPCDARWMLYRLQYTTELAELHWSTGLSLPWTPGESLPGQMASLECQVSFEGPVHTKDRIGSIHARPSEKWECSPSLTWETFNYGDLA